MTLPRCQHGLLLAGLTEGKNTQGRTRLGRCSSRKRRSAMSSLNSRLRKSRGVGVSFTVGGSSRAIVQPPGNGATSSGADSWSGIGVLRYEVKVWGEGGADTQPSGSSQVFVTQMGLPAEEVEGLLPEQLDICGHALLPLA